MGGPTSIQAILQALLPALSYGARDGFAHLHTLRNVEGLVTGAAGRLAAAGCDAAVVGQIREAGQGFDRAGEPERRQRLARLAALLSAHLSLPEALARLVVVEVPARPTTPVRPSPPKPEPASKEPEPVQPKAVRKPKRKRSPIEVDLDAGPNVGETEVVYPSVRPASGPLATPLKDVASLRGRIGQALLDRNITKVGEALFFFPRTYEDRRAPVPIARLALGERGCSVGTVKLVTESLVGRRKVFRVVLGDATGTIAATWYHYQFWMKQRFRVGERFVFSGEVRAFKGIREVAHPEMEPADEVEADAVNFGRIVPLYPGFERAEQRGFRAVVLKSAEAFAHTIDDPLPQALLERVGLPPLGQAVRQVHFPEGVDLETLQAHAHPAQRRLAFDELFFIELGMALRRKGIQLTRGIAFAAPLTHRERALSLIPFSLTGDQQKALGEILSDMTRPEPMHRLLQGDVGSGKTAVAIAAGLVAVQDGYQVAFLAPTEILAEQHHRTLRRWLGPAGFQVALLTAGVQKKEKEIVKEGLAGGRIQFVVGTHALLQEDVQFERLGLAVIDEQHRFGVLQRARLVQKGVRPDVLVMTATPIPRTLAMTLYGDLEVSIIRQMPPGRQPVKTRLFTERQRDRVHELIAAELDKGRQAFVVFPLVEESEKVDLESATEGARRLAESFPRHRVGLLHGRMTVEEKDAVMHAFREGQIHLLVSTTVVEVGVDVPNATVMVVESAERFGLSQLHQLRGRVGRGSERSFCFLVGATWHNPVALERLQVMTQTTDGFVIAEKDLELRGPGEFLGTRQSGVPGLSVANLMRDQDLLQLAREEARRLVDADSTLARPEHAGLKRALDERWEGKLGLARA